eukprot:TRINITY_DN1012_c8_g1_i1.p1 TRINITY_DN1012_c8_g1~~TRINITY_DN1012_c8_g1_i1.p1  ORF type:complete len:130 (+),score=7.79 TRINITY_DN1012_c8_g1_i1:45-434(+)
MCNYGNSCAPQPCPLPQPVIPRGLPPPACFQPPQSVCGPPPQQCCQPQPVCCPPVDNCCDRSDRMVNPTELSPLPPGLRDLNPCNPTVCPQPYRVPGGDNCPPWVRWGGPVGFNPGWGGSLWPGTGGRN